MLYTSQANDVLLQISCGSVNRPFCRNFQGSSNNYFVNTRLCRAPETWQFYIKLEVKYLKPAKYKIWSLGLNAICNNLIIISHYTVKVTHLHFFSFTHRNIILTNHTPYLLLTSKSPPPSLLAFVVGTVDSIVLSTSEILRTILLVGVLRSW